MKLQNKLKNLMTIRWIAKQTVKITLLAVFFISILSSCGFQLKKNVDLSETISKIHILDNNIDPVFVSFLKDSLVQRNIKVDSTSDIFIDLITYKEQKRAASINPSNADQAETQIIKTLEYAVVHTPSGGYLIAPNVVNLYKEYTNDNTNIAGKAEEERLIKKELDEELVQIILRRLQVIALEHKYSEAFETTKKHKTTKVD